MNHQPEIALRGASGKAKIRCHRAHRLAAPILATTLAALVGVSLGRAALADDSNDKAQQQAVSKASALVKTAGIACTITSARKLNTAGGSNKASSTGKSGDLAGNPIGNKQAGALGDTSTSSGLQGEYGSRPTPAPKVAAVESYEVSCSEGLGYVVSAAAKEKPTSYLCIEAVTGAGSDGAAQETPGLTPCVLAGNLPAAQLTSMQAYVTQAGIGCEPSRLRTVGRTDTDLVVELACGSGGGYVLSIPFPLQPGQTVKSANCLSLIAGGNVSCELTDVTTQRAEAEVQMRQAKPDCKISASRYMVSSLHGDNYFEFLCEDGSGFVAQQKAGGAAGATVSCSAAGVSKLGGCQLQKSNP
jgi:hypothetical protein